MLKPHFRASLARHLDTNGAALTGTVIVSAVVLNDGATYTSMEGCNLIVYDFEDIDPHTQDRILNEDDPYANKEVLNDLDHAASEGTALIIPITDLLKFWLSHH